MGAVNQSPGNCQCVAIGLVWFVAGCDGNGRTGCAIDVWTNSSKTIYIGAATDAGGGFYTLPVAGGSRYVEISSPNVRYALFADTYTYTAGVPRYLQLLPAAGYVCAKYLCPDPLKDVLQYTDANGTIPLSWNGTTWVGCSAKASMPLVVTSVNAGTCAPTLGTGTIKYRVVVDGTLGPLAGVGASWCCYDNGGPLAYSTDGTNTPSCSGGVLNCGTVVGSCATYLRNDGGGASVSRSCFPLNINGTYGNYGILGTANPAAGTYTTTE